MDMFIRSRTIMCGALIVLTGALAFGQGFGSGVADVLTQYRESLSYLGSVSLHATIIVNATNGDSTLLPQTLDYTFRQDRDTHRAQWVGKHLIHGEETHIDSTFIQEVADGQMLVSLESDRITPQPVNSRRAILWYDYKEKLTRLYENPNYGGPVFGTMYGSGHRSVADLLAQSSDLHLRNERETINGVPCVVVEGTSEYGKVTAWIAPEKGHNAMKWTIEKTPQHLFAEDSISKQRLSAESWQVTFEVKTIQGIAAKNSIIYVPELAMFTQRIDSRDGTPDVDTYEYKISDVQLNPDFAALNAFRIELPEGTRVFNREAPGLRFQWKDGKPAVVVDKAFPVDTDKETAALKGEVRAEGDGTTATLPEPVQGTPNPATALYGSPSRPARRWVYVGIAIVAIGIAGWLVCRMRKAQSC
jgi:hypothetical protein